MDKVVFDLIRLVCVQDNAYMCAFGIKSSGLIWVQKNPPTHTFLNLAHHLLRQSTVQTVGADLVPSFREGADLARPRSLVLPSLSSMQLRLRARARRSMCCVYASRRLTLRARARLSCVVVLT